MELASPIHSCMDGLSMSKRSDLWDAFARSVRDHINDYTVPQYGDYPDDLLEEFSAENCVRAIEKYVRRYGKNSRPGQAQLDMLKIAHYASEAYRKMGEDNG